MRKLFGHLAGKSHVVWDWNGTLLDDVEISVEALGTILESQGLPLQTRAKYLERFRFPIAEYYAEIGIEVRPESYGALAKQFIDSYDHRIERARLYTGVEDLLRDLAAVGVSSSVLSAAHEPDLKRLLDAYGISSHFTHVYGLGNKWAHGKIERGRQLMATIGLPAAQVILVGDTDHDLAVGQDLGIDVLLLTAGHQHESRLRSRHDRVVERY